MSYPLVGVIGRKRSGKDSFAATLVEEFAFQRVAFADPLKDVALAVDPLIHLEQLTPYVAHKARLSEAVAAIGWERVKDEYPEARRILQVLGVAVRDKRPDFWLGLALEKIASAPAPVVVTDVRFPNEAEALVDRGGFIVRVLRDGTMIPGQHVSETALDDYPEDFTVSNNGTLDDLRGVARTIADSIVS